MIETATGYCNDTMLNNMNYSGYLWSSSLNSSNSNNSHYLYFDCYGDLNMNNNNRYYGQSIRGV